MKVKRAILAIICFVLAMTGLIFMMGEPVGTHTIIGLIMFVAGCLPEIIKKALASAKAKGIHKNHYNYNSNEEKMQCF